MSFSVCTNRSSSVSMSLVTHPMGGAPVCVDWLSAGPACGCARPAIRRLRKHQRAPSQRRPPTFQSFVFFELRSDDAGFPVGLVAALVPPSVASLALSSREPDFGSAVGAAVEPPPAAGLLSFDLDDREPESVFSAGPA